MSAVLEKPKEKKGISKRRVPRRPIDINVGLLVAGIYYITKALEVGEGGMLIVSPVHLKKHQRVVVTVRLSGVLQGAMLSKVVYILEPQGDMTDTHYGIQFENIEFDVKRKIRNFVASSSGSYVVRTSVEEKEFLEEDDNKII